MGRSSGETDREVGQKHKGRQDMRVKYLSRKFSEAFESHNAWRKTRKHKSKTEELAEFHQIETAQSIAQTHKLNDVVLDFSSDPKINATRFTEIYKNALIKANPRSNPSVIKSLINCKWKEFRINQTEKEQKSSNEPEIKKPRTRKAILLNELENKKFTPKKAKGKLTLKDHKEILAQPQKVEKAKIVKESKPEGKIEDESCYHCSKAGTQLICNTCLKFFHIDCTFPPLKSKPIKWKCQYCKAPELENPIEKIFFWKYVDLSIPSIQFIV
ncbi:hypothetical protein MXB_2349 [Myxobolus squamalis]|nr:hypothetical protein MXB_2349 [Myxobolus squamalis]